MTKYLTITEICEELKISKPTLNKLREEGLPFEKWGRLVRFDKDAVYEWLKNRNK